MSFFCTWAKYSIGVIGYWLFVIGYWLFVIGYWLLVVGYWLLVICYLYISLVAETRSPSHPHF
ncbi:hypothetical protein QUA35_08930 [Microcoleus sp. N9_B2]